MFECGGGETVWQVEDDGIGVRLACSSSRRKEPRQEGGLPLISGQEGLLD